MEGKNSKIRLGIVGVGVMGTAHLRSALSLGNVDLTALCDTDPDRLERSASLAAKLAEGKGKPAIFSSYGEMLDSGLVDSILVSTPHYAHEPISISALERGIHVLVEKPLTVTTRGARNMIAAYRRARLTWPGLKFAEMFMQRTYGHWIEMRRILGSGELGRITRVNWIVTDWFRTQAYYDSGGWRATWGGEGGGILVNQAPHDLDILQWIFGMPKRLAAFASLGKYHDIDVEDEVSAYMEWEGGMIGHFFATTAESPGINRLEIVGERGRILFEGGKLLRFRNGVSMLEFLRTSESSYGPIPCSAPVTSVYFHHGESGHRIVMENFAEAILGDKPLVAEAEEGLNQVALSNAMTLSALTGNKSVEFPLDEDEYDSLLARLVKEEEKKR